MFKSLARLSVCGSIALASGTAPAAAQTSDPATLRCGAFTAMTDSKRRDAFGPLHSAAMKAAGIGQSDSVAASQLGALNRARDNIRAANRRSPGEQAAADMKADIEEVGEDIANRTENPAALDVPDLVKACDGNADTLAIDVLTTAMAR